jgi:hypothetical protein
MKRYIFFSSGRARDVFHTFAKLVLADRLLEMRFGKRIELCAPINICKN